MTEKYMTLTEETLAKENAELKDRIFVDEKRFEAIDKIILELVLLIQDYCPPSARPQVKKLLNDLHALK